MSANEEELEPHDATPAEAAKWRFIRKRAFAAFTGYGFREVQTSPLEPNGTAPRTLNGPAMQTGQAFELRQDLLASLARVFVAKGDPDERFVRWMTSGNLFDPRPLGALRWPTWHGVGGLVLGAGEPAAEAEMAGLLLTLAADVGLKDAEVVLATVGDAGDVARFVDASAGHRALLCPLCRDAVSPLRFLSCPEDGCQSARDASPPLREFVSIAAQKHHEAVLGTVEASGFTVRDDPRLGFGAVGAYTRTQLELRARHGQGFLSVARGGRRDRLVSGLSGVNLPAVGVTLGVARLAACAPGEDSEYESPCEVFFAARGAGARAFALKAAAVERARGFRVDVDLREVGWADQLQRAEKIRARIVVLVGDVERKRGEVALRDMSTREVRQIPEERLSLEIKRLLR